MDWKNLTFVLLLIVANIEFCRNAPVPYTYVASIRIDTKPVCVGMILTTTWIITVCDCVSRMQKTPSRVTARVGIISNEARIEEAREVICHTAYKSNHDTPAVNLALLRFREGGIKLGDSVRKGLLPLTATRGNATKTITLKIARQPTDKARNLLIGWMKDLSYYTMRTDPGWRLWVEHGIVGKESDCKKYKEWRPSMICAVFFQTPAKSCDAFRGTLLVYNKTVWGLMSYKYTGCGDFHNYVPYVNLGQKFNLQFIINTVREESWKRNQ